MRRSPLPRRSRRRLLADAGLLTLAAVSTTAACTSEDPNGVTMDDLADRDPMDMDLLALTNLRQPGQPDDRVAVTVQGRRITRVAEVAADGVPTLDMDGGWLVPGFVDAHVHLQFTTPGEVLAGGVTTVRDLGGPADAAQSLIGRTPLKVLIAGRILTPVGGYPSRSWGADGTAREVTDVEDAVRAVEEQVLAGATVVKVALEPSGGAPMFDLASVQAIVTRAREYGLRTTAHCGSAAALEIAIEAGVRELAHLPLHAVSPAEMVAAAEAGMVLVPTLEIRGEDPDALAAVAAFREAGGEVLYGSDLGNGGTAPGIEVTEVEAMLGAGMTPSEVLRSATSDPALYLGLDTGRIEERLLADLVVLGGNPFEDPRHYDDVRLVMASGEIVHEG